MCSRLQERPRFGVAAQTTQPIEKVRLLVNCLRRRFPNSEVRFIDTVCQPTKQRQNAAVELAQQCDVVIVIGGAHSNNTHELVETCCRYCPRVHHVQTADDLRPGWFENANVGASPPELPRRMMSLTAWSKRCTPSLRSARFTVHTRCKRKKGALCD